MITQLALPGMEAAEEYICPLCQQVTTLFGQYSPFMPWGVCRDCSIKYPYPVEIIVLSTRRNASKVPLMIDPDSSAELRERRVIYDEMLRCGIDPTRIERPVVKYNLSGLEIRNPVRRSRMRQFGTWLANARHNLTYRQISAPVCWRCGCAHERAYEMLPGVVDYYSKCQRCDDEESVESLFRQRGIFAGDDDEAVLDRLYKAFPALFERGVLPDYWFVLKGRE